MPAQRNSTHGVCLGSIQVEHFVLRRRPIYRRRTMSPNAASLLHGCMALSKRSCTKVAEFGPVEEGLFSFWCLEHGLH